MLETGVNVPLEHSVNEKGEHVATVVQTTVSATGRTMAEAVRNVNVLIREKFEQGDFSGLK
jgi:hypothetical protein